MAFNRVKDIDLIRLYKKMRFDAKLTYTEIRQNKKFAKKDKKQFRRWNDYINRGIFELSTVREDSSLQTRGQ